MKKLVLGNGYILEWETVNGVVNGFLNGNEIAHSKPSLLWNEQQFVDHWQLACAKQFDKYEYHNDSCGYGHNAMSSFIFNR